MKARHIVSIPSLALLALLLVAGSVHAQEETLDINFTTSDTTWSGSGGIGPFSPNNYHAVWIENSSGEHVLTLGRQGENFWYDLRNWALSSGHDVDSVTGATDTSFGARSISGAVITGIPDGSYNIVMEGTVWEVPLIGQNNLARFPFNKNGTGVTLTPAASGGFSGVGITYSGRSSGNYAPGVYAGPDFLVDSSTTPAMEGVATDDGGTPTVTWSQVDGPATAVFTDSGDPTTMVTFPEGGRYVLRLTASDGARSSSDEVTVLVNPLILSPVADAQVNSTMASMNYGATPWLAVNDNVQAYLRFNFSSLAGTTITGAILRMATAEGGYATVLRQIRRVDDDSWDEMSITWSSRPSADSTVLATIGTDRGWVEADLTTAVQAESDGVLSINIRSASTPGQWIMYNSKDRSPMEMGAHFTPPELIVFTETSSTPDATTDPAADPVDAPADDVPADTPEDVATDLPADMATDSPTDVDAPDGGDDGDESGGCGCQIAY